MLSEDKLQQTLNDMERQAFTAEMLSTTSLQISHEVFAHLLAIAKTAAALRDWCDDIQKANDCEYFKKDHQPGACFLDALTAALAALAESDTARGDITP